MSFKSLKLNHILTTHNITIGELFQVHSPFFYFPAQPFLIFTGKSVWIQKFFAMPFEICLLPC